MVAKVKLTSCQGVQAPSLITIVVLAACMGSTRLATHVYPALPAPPKVLAEVWGQAGDAPAGAAAPAALTHVNQQVNPSTPHASDQPGLPAVGGQADPSTLEFAAMVQDMQEVEARQGAVPCPVERVNPSEQSPQEDCVPSAGMRHSCQTSQACERDEPSVCGTGGGLGNHHCCSVCAPAVWVRHCSHTAQS